MPSLIQTISGFAGGATSLAINVGNSAGNGTQNTTPGSMLVAYVCSPTTGRTCGCSDNVNGTYNTDVALVSSGGIFTAPDNGGGAVTITGTLSGAAGQICMIIEEWSGIALIAPLDKTTTNTAATQTSGNTGTTTTLSASTDLALAMMVLNQNGGAGFAVQSPFTASTVSPVFGGASIFLATGYQILGSNAGVVANFSWTNASTYRGGIATYKIGSVGTDTLLGQGWV